MAAIALDFAARELDESTAYRFVFSRLFQKTITTVSA